MSGFEQTEKVFTEGLIVRRNENAPDFVTCSLAFKMDEFIEWARKHHKDGWVNVDCKLSKGGKYYAELNTFKPSEKAVASAGVAQARQVIDNSVPVPDIADDEIPF